MKFSEINNQVRILILYVRLTFLSFFVYFGLICEGVNKSNNPTIKVSPNVWGGAKIESIQKVLESTAKQFTPYIWQKNLKPIHVSRSRTGPIVLYRRGPNGEYLVRLSAQKTFWNQYAFQFAHEFGHIICGYKKGDQSNNWFEESICETASLYALINMTKDWKQKPPYQNWKSYANAFAKYANERIKKNPWPKNISVANWYRKHKNSLEKNPANRERNVKLASKFLPLFTQNPQGWGSCAFMNKKQSDNKRSFKKYLLDWRDSCQSYAQKKFVTQFIIGFGFNK